MPVPDFAPNEMLTAAAMDAIGLWKVAGTSFSAKSNFDITGFSSTYNRYRVIITTRRVDTTGMGTFTAKLYNNTTPISANYYEGMGYSSYLAADGSKYTRNNGAEWIWGNSDSATATSIWSYDLFALSGSGATYTGGGFSVGEAQGIFGGGSNGNTGTFDRIRIAYDYGTHSGTWALYGYRD